MIISPPSSPFPSLCRIKKTPLVLALICLNFTYSACIPYLFHIGSEQARILWNREKIESVLLTNQLPEASRVKLKLIQEARDYGFTKLALNKEGGFVYYSNLDREEIGWNVSGSKALAFESFTWWFPIAGTIPYKGYFDEKRAQALESELKSDGLDTRIRVIGGYSTLGWFSDPVLSPQLKWKNYRLVGLVFHELAHATAYLPGDSDLNESYASFVEEKGLEQFYLDKEGETSPSLLAARKEKEARKEIFILLKKYAHELETVYKSEKSKEEKLIGKQKIIHLFKEEILSQKIIPENKVEEFRKREWNNEDFLGVLRYHSGETNFEKIFKNVGQDFGQFHLEVKNIFKLSPSERKLFLDGI